MTLEVDRTYIVEIIKLNHEASTNLESWREMEKRRDKEHTASEIESEHQKNE